MTVEIATDETASPTKNKPRAAVLRCATAIRLRLRVRASTAPGGVIAVKAAHGARSIRARIPPMMTSRCRDDGEHAADLSPSARLLDELQLYGHRPFEDEPDPRPLPDPKGSRARSPTIRRARCDALRDPA